MNHIERAREVLDIEIAGIETVKKEMGEGFVQAIDTMLETVENLQLQIISLHKQLEKERNKNLQNETTLVRLLKEQQKTIDLLARKVEALEARGK